MASRICGRAVEPMPNSFPFWFFLNFCPTFPPSAPQIDLTFFFQWQGETSKNQKTALSSLHYHFSNWGVRSHSTSVKPSKNQSSIYQLQFHLRLQVTKSMFRVEDSSLPKTVLFSIFKHKFFLFDCFCCLLFHFAFLGRGTVSVKVLHWGLEYCCRKHY